MNVDSSEKTISWHASMRKNLQAHLQLANGIVRYNKHKIGFDLKAAEPLLLLFEGLASLRGQSRYPGQIDGLLLSFAVGTLTITISLSLSLRSCTKARTRVLCHFRCSLSAPLCAFLFGRTK